MLLLVSGTANKGQVQKMPQDSTGALALLLHMGYARMPLCTGRARASWMFQTQHHTFLAVQSTLKQRRLVVVAGNASFERLATAPKAQQRALQDPLLPIAPAGGLPHATQAQHAAWGFSSEDERAQ